MSDNANKSGQQVGADNVNKLKAYLDGVEAVPARGGKVNVTAIAEACGFDRGVLYQNPTAKKMLAEAVEMKGLKGTEVRAEKADMDRLVLENKVASLESKNSALVAEVYELKRKLKQLQHVEIAMMQGKRVDL